MTELADTWIWFSPIDFWILIRKRVDRHQKRHTNNVHVANYIPIKNTVIQSFGNVHAIILWANSANSSSAEGCTAARLSATCSTFLAGTWSGTGAAGRPLPRRAGLIFDGAVGAAEDSLSDSDWAQTLCFRLTNSHLSWDGAQGDVYRRVRLLRESCDTMLIV